jgi:hypothetical protein
LNVQVDDTRQFNAVRKSFVDRCMERLQLAHQQITFQENVANAQNQIDRLIFMLKVRIFCEKEPTSLLTSDVTNVQNFLQESKTRDEKKKKEVGTAPVIVGPTLPKLEPVAAAPPKNIPQVRKVATSSFSQRCS